MPVERRVRGDIATADALEVPAYVIANDTPDRAFDAGTVVTAELADIVATLIRDLARAGIVNV